MDKNTNSDLQQYNNLKLVAESKSNQQPQLQIQTPTTSLSDYQSCLCSCNNSISMPVYETNPRLLRRNSLTKAFDINYSITSSSSSEDHSRINPAIILRPPHCTHCNSSTSSRKDQTNSKEKDEEFSKLPLDEKRKKFNYKTKLVSEELRSNASPTESFCSCRSSTCNFCTCDSATLTPSSPAGDLDNSNTNSSSNVVDGADDEATEVEDYGQDDDEEDEDDEEEEKVLSRSTKL